MSIEEITFGDLMVNPNCYCVSISDGDTLKTLTEVLKVSEDKSIIVNEIVYNRSEPAVPSNALLTYSKEKDVDRILRYVDDSCSKVVLSEIIISGTGLTRSYETLHEVFLYFKKNEINLLAQICTDLNLKFYVEKTQADLVYKAMHHLIVAYKFRNTNNFN